MSRLSQKEIGDGASDQALNQSPSPIWNGRGVEVRDFVLVLPRFMDRRREGGPFGMALLRLTEDVPSSSSDFPNYFFLEAAFLAGFFAAALAAGFFFSATELTSVPLRGLLFAPQSKQMIAR